jgi:hypothetical protein
LRHQPKQFTNQRLDRVAIRHHTDFGDRANTVRISFSALVKRFGGADERELFSAVSLS